MATILDDIGIDGPHTQKIAVIIGGPTASGKSRFGVELAKRIDGEIVNADALQLYADLRILSARPSLADEAGIAHHLYGCLDGGAAASAAQWRDMALATLSAIWARRRVPIVVGGTGLYLRTLLDGIAPVPPTPTNIREAVRAMSAVDLAGALANEDPQMMASLNPHDSQRLARALEVVRATGRSLRSFHGPQSDGLRASAQIVATRFMPDRAALYAACDQRLEQMIATGALAEIKALAERQLSPALPVMKAVGVPELLGMVRGQTDLPTALAAAKLSTRHYAKRQYTWFRNQCADWLCNPGLEDVVKLLL